MIFVDGRQIKVTNTEKEWELSIISVHNILFKLFLWKNKNNRGELPYSIVRNDDTEWAKYGGLTDIFSVYDQTMPIHMAGTKLIEVVKDHEENYNKELLQQKDVQEYLTYLETQDK